MSLWMLWYALTPATIVHEYLHALVATPWAEKVDVSFERDGAAVEISWSDGTPIWAVYLAHGAPMLIGLGLVILLVALFGIPQVSSVEHIAIHEAGLWAVLVANWAVLTYPSYEDRHPLTTL